jgi:hypothetical protein
MATTTPPLQSFNARSPLRVVAIGLVTGFVVAIVMPPQFSNLSKLAVMFVFGLAAGLFDGWISYAGRPRIRPRG